MRKFLIIITVLGFLSSCQMTKCYQYVRTDQVVYRDVVHFQPIHIHKKDTTADFSHTRCTWIPAWDLEIVDTCYIDIFERKLVRKRKCH